MEDKSINSISEMESNLKDDLIVRLNKVEGQVRGIKRMINEENCCGNVINQVSAVQAALNSLNKLVLENHIRKCLCKKINEENKDIIDELVGTIGKLYK